MRYLAENRLNRGGGFIFFDVAISRLQLCDKAERHFDSLLIEGIKEILRQFAILYIRPRPFFQVPGFIDNIANKYQAKADSRLFRALQDIFQCINGLTNSYPPSLRRIMKGLRP